MSKGKHTEAEMIGALKQVKVAPSQLDNFRRPKLENKLQFRPGRIGESDFHTCYQQIGGWLTLSEYFLVSDITR
jgi:hypothetical protein